MSEARQATRSVSSALFDNEKFVEVVLALNASGSAHAQALATTLTIPQSLVRAVLQRLQRGGLVEALPRAHRRAALYYEPTRTGDRWRALVRLCQALDSTPAVDDQREQSGLTF